MRSMIQLAMGFTIFIQTSSCLPSKEANDAVQASLKTYESPKFSNSRKQDESWEEFWYRGGAMQVSLLLSDQELQKKAKSFLHSSGYFVIDRDEFMNPTLANELSHSFESIGKKYFTFSEQLKDPESSRLFQHFKKM